MQNYKKTSVFQHEYNEKTVFLTISAKGNYFTESVRYPFADEFLLIIIGRIPNERFCLNPYFR
jgi:hypothetical protein